MLETADLVGHQPFVRLLLPLSAFRELRVQPQLEMQRVALPNGCPQRIAHLRRASEVLLLDELAEHEMGSGFLSKERSRISKSKGAAHLK